MYIQGPSGFYKNPAFTGQLDNLKYQILFGDRECRIEYPISGKCSAVAMILQHVGILYNKNRNRVSVSKATIGGIYCAIKSVLFVPIAPIPLPSMWQGGCCQITDISDPVVVGFDAPIPYELINSALSGVIHPMISCAFGLTLTDSMTNVKRKLFKSVPLLRTCHYFSDDLIDVKWKPVL